MSSTLSIERRGAAAIIAILLIAAPWTGISGAAEPATRPAASQPAGANGLNVLIVGHSLTHGLRAMEPLAMAVGHPAHKQDLYTFLGASVGYHYGRLGDVADRRTGKTYRDLFFPPNKKWDALIISARDADYRGPKFVSGDEINAPKLAAEAFRNNPNCQIFIYGNWAGADQDLEKPPYGNSEAHIERVAAAVTKAFPDAPKVRVMPCSLLFRELMRLAERGELPGVPTRFGLFSDGAHQNRTSSYAVNLLVCAMVYNESPRDYPLDIRWKGNDWRNPDWSVRVPEPTAAVIKRVVWDILQTYPPAGMPPRLVIANRRLDPAIAGHPYSVELKALNAAGPCTWSIAKGALPNGISLSPAGVVAGQSDAAGEYPLTIALSDGKNTIERSIVLSVARDTPPSLPDQAFPQVSLDQYLLHPLKLDGGVGHITWSIAEGKLPHGIMLTPNGMLMGTPGQAGDFDFKLKVVDSSPGGPRTAERPVRWTVAPASPQTAIVKYIVVEERDKTDGVISIDGKLDEACWKLDQPIAKKVRGTPTQTATFGLLGSKDKKPSRWSRQLYVAVKVLDGPKGKTAKDGVHLFIDGNHNRSVIYSADDTHFFIARSQKPGGAQTIRGKVNWFSRACVQEIEGGYTVEVRLDATYFTGEGNWLTFGPGAVYGFDIAVDEGDGNEVARQVWQGDANDAEDTSHFGAILLVNEPAIPPAGPATSRP